MDVQATNSDDSSSPSKLSLQIAELRHHNEEVSRLQALNQKLQSQVNDLSFELSAIMTIVTEAGEELGLDYTIAESPLDFVAILIEYLKLRQDDARPQGAPLE